MALNPSSGYVAASTLQDLNENSLPIFSVERVQLQFSTASDFAAAQVANNILILALANGRILRIDLDAAEDIDGTSCLEMIMNVSPLILF
jgi:vacuolar protein sorting-associated protein 18